MLGSPSYLTTGYIAHDLYLPSGSYGSILTPFINFMSDSFTIELWIRIDAIPETGFMVLISQNDLLLSITSDGRLTIDVTSPASGERLKANIWYHLALAFDSSIEQQKIYVNGLLDSTSTQGFYSNATNPFRIGTYDSSSDYFIGQIDHFSITTRLKSASEILRDATLLASYPFTGDFGSAPLDTGPYGFPGTLSASTHQITTGAVGDALSFNSTSDYFQVLSECTNLVLKNVSDG